jgi:phosphotransferase system HPr (HPr) family protein
VKKRYIVVDQKGLTANPANKLATLTSKLSNDILIHYDGVAVTTKSTISILSLGVPYQGEISIIVKGDNADKIHQTIYQTLKHESLIE